MELPKMYALCTHEDGSRRGHDIPHLTQDEILRFGGKPFTRDQALIDTIFPEYLGEIVEVELCCDVFAYAAACYHNCGVNDLRTDEELDEEKREADKRALKERARIAAFEEEMREMMKFSKYVKENFGEEFFVEEDLPDEFRHLYHSHVLRNWNGKRDGWLKEQLAKRFEDGPVPEKECPSALRKHWKVVLKDWYKKETHTPDFDDPGFGSLVCHACQRKLYRGMNAIRFAETLKKEGGILRSECKECLGLQTE